MKKLFLDLSNDWSSGLLVKFLAFLFAFEFGVLALALGADLSAIAAAVGSLLGLVTAFQWIQSATGNGMPSTPAQLGVTVVPVSIMDNPQGSPDLARWIKFLAFIAGVVILHVALIWIRGQLMNAVGVAGAFFVLCTSQELSTKATGT